MIGTNKVIIAGILLLGMQAAMIRAEPAPTPPVLRAGGDAASSKFESKFYKDFPLFSTAPSETAARTPAVLHEPTRCPPVPVFLA